MVSIVVVSPTDFSACARAGGVEALRLERGGHALRERDGRDALARLLEPGPQQRELLADGELVLGRVAEDRVGHVVVGADLRTRVGLPQDRLELLRQPRLPVVGHATSSSA